MSDQRVREQYESYPYPARDPRDEARRLIVGSPGHLMEMNHYLFAGRRDFSRPFRALVAGGGTGDASVMLSQQLADAGGGGEVVYLDMSKASREICEARVKARNLRNVRFETGSLLDVASMGLGEFDYVDCCGVLHHLEDPAAGLAALKSVLAPGGGIGFMVYGELGRIGVYHMQAMMRLLDEGAPDKERVALAKRLYGVLPETNWLKRNPFVGDHLEGGAAGVYDLLLHSRDRAYRVPEILDLVEGAGMAVTAFVDPARYDPASYVADPRIAKSVEKLGRWQRAAFAELMVGNLRKHTVYCVPKGREDEAVADPEDLEYVPVLHQIDGPEWAKGFQPGNTIGATIDGFRFKFPLPPLSGAIMGRIDGHRRLADILADMASSNSAVDEAKFRRQWRQLYTALNGLGRLFLARPETP